MKEETQAQPNSKERLPDIILQYPLYLPNIHTEGMTTENINAAKMCGEYYVSKEALQPLVDAWHQRVMLNTMSVKNTLQPVSQVNLGGLVYQICDLWDAGLMDDVVNLYCVACEIAAIKMFVYGSTTLPHCQQIVSKVYPAPVQILYTLQDAYPSHSPQLIAQSYKNFIKMAYDVCYQHRKQDAKAQAQSVGAPDDQIEIYNEAISKVATHDVRVMYPLSSEVVANVGTAGWASPALEKLAPTYLYQLLHLYHAIEEHSLTGLGHQVITEFSQQAIH